MQTCDIRFITKLIDSDEIHIVFIQSPVYCGTLSYHLYMSYAHCLYVVVFLWMSLSTHTQHQQKTPFHGIAICLSLEPPVRRRFCGLCSRADCVYVLTYGLRCLHSTHRHPHIRSQGNHGDLTYRENELCENLISGACDSIIVWKFTWRNNSWCSD